MTITELPEVHEPTPEPTKNHNVRSLVIGAVAIAVVFGGIGAAASHKSTTAPTPAQVAAAAVATPTPAAQSTPTASWLPIVTADEVAEVQAMTSITTDASNQDLVAVLSDCSSAAALVPGWTADAALITVDSIRTPYTQALTFYGESFTACAGGDLPTATTLIGQATAQIQAATAATKAYNAGN